MQKPSESSGEREVLNLERLARFTLEIQIRDRPRHSAHAEYASRAHVAVPGEVGERALDVVNHWTELLDRSRRRWRYGRR